MARVCMCVCVYTCVCVCTHVYVAGKGNIPGSRNKSGVKTLKRSRPWYFSRSWGKGQDQCWLNRVFVSWGPTIKCGHLAGSCSFSQVLNTQDFLSLLSRTLTHHQGAGRCHLPITPLVSWDSVPSFNLYTYRLGNRDPCAHFLGKKTSLRRCNVRLYLIFKSIQQKLTDSYNR